MVSVLIRILSPSLPFPLFLLVLLLAFPRQALVLDPSAFVEVDNQIQLFLTCRVERQVMWPLCIRDRQVQRIE